MTRADNTRLSGVFPNWILSAGIGPNGRYRWRKALLAPRPLPRQG